MWFYRAILTPFPGKSLPPFPREQGKIQGIAPSRAWSSAGFPSKMKEIELLSGKTFLDPIRATPTCCAGEDCRSELIPFPALRTTRLALRDPESNEWSKGIVCGPTADPPKQGAKGRQKMAGCAGPFERPGRQGLGKG
jgi:hypothetical protein